MTQWPLARVLLQRFLQLVVLVLALSTLLFFLLRAAGDPAVILAGQDAAPEQLEAIRKQYGLDGPLSAQYLRYLGEILRLDFGRSLLTGEDALGLALQYLGTTLVLAVLTLLLTATVSLLAGVWIAGRTTSGGGRMATGLLFVLQGVPGFVTAILLVQLFAVRWGLLPGFGTGSWAHAVLPVAALASFLVPKTTRILAANIEEALAADYVRTARAIGASRREILWRHVLPNALIGATALLGTQFAFLVSGAVVTETLFVWPGIGWLLLQSTRVLDFPVVQAIGFVIAILVFLVNTLTDLLTRWLDPRLAWSADR